MSTREPHLHELVMAEAASLVWRVERTRCPVRDASVAIKAVSWSRISPIMMMWGRFAPMTKHGSEGETNARP